jgi:hypothetical protein
MGTLLGDALARAGVITKEQADQAEKVIEEDRKRKLLEETKKAHAARRAEETALKERGCGFDYDLYIMPEDWEDS